MILQKIYKKIILILITIVISMHSPVEGAQKKFTVIIDAGHGGKDIGATDNGVMEKNINLKVAKELEALVKKKMKDANVVMTRNSDEYLTLQERADKANKAQGDIFISIHTNSVDKSNKNRRNLAGSQVYTLGLHKDENNLNVAMRENSVIELEQDYEEKYSGFDPQRDESYIIFEMAQKKNLSRSILFAEDIEKELVKSGRNDRGVHQAGFWVLWATSMPSVLIELDFICNPESASYISSDKGSKELAEAIFKALQKYEKSWERTQKDSKTVKVNDKSETEIEDQNVDYEEVLLAYEDNNVGTVRKRSHLTTDNSDKEDYENNSLSTPEVKKSTARRRRSKQSRDLSLNNSYESKNLIINGVKPIAIVVDKEEESLLAVNSSKSKTKTKEDKKKEKEEQKRAKEELKKEAKQRKSNAHNAKINKFVTVYKIQILASEDLLSQNNSRFCGLFPITAFKENNLYKYYYGESSNREDMEAILSDVKKKIPDAFIVSSQKIMQK